MDENAKAAKLQNTISILKRLNHLTTHKSSIPQRLAASYAVDVRNGEDSEPVMAEYLSALAAEQSGQLGLALQFIERALLIDPADICGCAMIWRLCGTISTRVEEQGHENSASLDFLKNYEMLLSLGEVTLECHLLAAQGYALLAEKEKAKQIVDKLSNVAPNYPGLASLRESLGIVLPQLKGVTKNGKYNTQKKKNAA